MKKTPPKTKTQTTHGAHHDVTNPKNTGRPTDRALHPTTPLEIMISRAMDQELEWYFSYAESALRHARVGMLPSYAAALVTEPSDSAIQDRAHEVARIVRGCLIAVRPRHAAVLRAVYTPRSWPKSVFKAWGGLTAIVVRLAFADDPWPERMAREGLEQAAALRLAAGLTSSSVSVPKLRNQAQRLLDSAVRAYAGLRALEGTLPGVG